MIYAVITGDIVNSQAKPTETWSSQLQNSLRKYTDEFDIFRGDSFQAIVKKEDVFEFIFYLFARIQSIEGLSVRLGVGFGEIDFYNNKVKQSTGEAFTRSGVAFDHLKKDLIRIDTPWQHFNETINLLMSLCEEIVIRWTPNMAETVAVAIDNPEKNQNELGKILGRKYQSQVSTELTKANFHKLMKTIEYCTKAVQEQC